MIQLISKTTEDTKTLGKIMAPFFKKGDTVVLSGDLGAGKTMFVTGFLSFYGKENEASSPTFTIINEHSLTNDLKLFHFDVYRFQMEEEFLAIGGEEFFEQGICFIEWGEKITHYLPQAYLKVVITKDSEDKDIRKIELIPIGEKYEELLTSLTEVLEKDEYFSR